MPLSSLILAQTGPPDPPHFLTSKKTRTSFTTSGTAPYPGSFTTAADPFKHHCPAPIRQYSPCFADFLSKRMKGERGFSSTATSSSSNIGGCKAAGDGLKIGGEKETSFDALDADGHCPVPPDALRETDCPDVRRFKMMLAGINPDKDSVGRKNVFFWFGTKYK